GVCGGSGEAGAHRPVHELDARCDCCEPTTDEKQPSATCALCNAGWYAATDHRAIYHWLFGCRLPPLPRAEIPRELWLPRYSGAHCSACPRTSLAKALVGKQDFFQTKFRVG